MTAAKTLKSATVSPTPRLATASPSPKATLLATATLAGKVELTATPATPAEAAGGSSGGWWVWVLAGVLVVLVCIGLVMWRRRAAHEPKS